MTQPIDEFMTDETRALIRIESLLIEIRDALVRREPSEPVKLVTEYPRGTAPAGQLWSKDSERACLMHDPDGLGWSCSLPDDHTTRHEALWGDWMVASWEK